MRFFVLSAVFLLSSGISFAGLSDAPHPRLLWQKGGEAVVRERVASDPLAGRLSGACLARAREILDERTCRYEIPDGKRLLGESRRALDHVVHCAWAWRMTGEERFRERTVRELDAACALKDWNPKHFLDVAEMSLAVAVGYDWLFDSLTPEQRARCEEAIVAKALKPALKVYESHGWWSKPGNNWSQVCGSGIAMAAAAVAERDPKLCGDLFGRGKKLIDDCTRFYEPDGVYPEGPAYWGYGTNYHVILLAACPALGLEAPAPEALRKSGDFMMQVVGPFRLPFNFADAGAGRAAPTPAQSWIASHFHDSGQASYVRSRLAGALDGKGKSRWRGGRFAPLHLLWLPDAPPAGIPDAPLVASFRGKQSLAFFRTSWRPGAAYLAIKGGTPSGSHGHMDVGVFVYDAAGVRWFHDLGSDDYNMPGYFGGKRWSYFRLNNRSHNTLVIGGQLQKVRASPAKLVERPSVKSPAVAIDLTPAYEGQAEKVLRRAEFDIRTGAVVIDDRIDHPAGDVRWAVVTRAKVSIDGRRAVLEQAGKSLVVTRLDDAGGDWDVRDATPPTAREKQNKGCRMLSFTAPAAESLRLRVRWEPKE